MSRTAIAAVLLLATVAALPGCSPGADGTRDLADAPVLRRGNGRDPTTLDPSRAVDVHAFSVLADLYEGLVAHAADGRIVPGAAAAWTHDDSRRRFEFRLRADARWSNGDPVTAEDFVRAFRRAVDPSTNAPYAAMLSDFAGFNAIRAGDAPASVLGVSAPDARTLIVELTRPGHTLLQRLAMPIAAPIHASMAASDSFGNPKAFVGNGPYRLASYRPGDRIRVEANPYHHAVGELGYCRVEFLPISDPAIEVNLYRAGDIDITETIAPAQLAALRAQMPDAVRIAPMLGVYFLAFDTSEPALDALALREALSMAIDREQLVALLGRGEQPAFGLLPPGLSISVDLPEWAGLPAAERQARARERLRVALGDSPAPALTLVYDVGDVHERIALAVADMWRETLGIETRLDKREWTYFLDTRDQRAEWDAMRYMWFGDYADAANFLEIFRSGSEHNLPAFADADYDALLNAATRAGDQAERAAHLADAAARLNASHSIAPLYYFVSKHLVRPGIEGFEDNALNRHPSRYLRPGASPEGCR